jgi:hypothetical protein
MGGREFTVGNICSLRCASGSGVKTKVRVVRFQLTHPLAEHLSLRPKEDHMGVRIFASIVPLVLAVLAAASPARAESATCSAPGGSTYRVTWNVENSSFGPLARISGLHRQQGTTWLDQSASTWQLRWELTPPELVGIVGAFKEKTGTLSTLTGNPVATYLSPNVVVPDGSCVVYMYPFAQASGPKVAVVGDSLTESLRDSTFNQTWLQGYVQGALASAGRRAEVEGQGGRRWSPTEGLTGLAKADSYLLDELRGLRTTSGGLQTIVVALGANDAGWVALAAPRPSASGGSTTCWQG